MNYFILGASSDVGLTFIKSLNIKDDDKIYAHYNSDASVFNGISGIIPIKADLTIDEERKRLCESIKDSIDVILFLPALRFDYMRLKALDLDRIRKQMEVGPYAFLDVCHHFLPAMKKSGGRVIVMLTKYVTDDMPPKFMTDYIVSKYALMGAYKSMKAEYENERLMFSYIAPDMMNTKFLSNIDPRILEMNGAERPGGVIPGPEDTVKEIMDLINS